VQGLVQIEAAVCTFSHTTSFGDAGVKTSSASTGVLMDIKSSHVSH
jgi:hypothetical protein